MLVWLQCGMQVPRTPVWHWRFCSGRQAWFCQHSLLKRIYSNKRKGCRAMVWISYRGARRRMVPSALGRAPRAAPAWCRQPVSPGSHQPRWVPLPGHSHAERVADGLVRAEDKPRTAVGSCRYARLFTTNTGVKAAARSNGTQTQGNRVLKMVRSKTSQRIGVPCFRCIFQFHFTCQT